MHSALSAPKRTQSLEMEPTWMKRKCHIDGEKREICTKKWLTSLHGGGYKAMIFLCRQYLFDGNDVDPDSRYV